MASFEIQCEEEQYRIVTADGQESEFANYGEVAAINVGKDVYYAICDIDKEGDLVAGCSQVYRVASVSAVTTTVEDVELEDDEDEDEEETEDEEEPEEVEVED
jgi:hypothetical protein